jgi:hypothetical protein
MDTEEIKQTTETKHLGIKRNNKNNIDTEDRIKLTRRTIYTLLGPGLHARRGMSLVLYSVFFIFTSNLGDRGSIYATY